MKYREERYYYVYISTNKTNSVLYTRVTNNLLNRDDQHKKKINKNSFTAKYNINKVVYYEVYTDICSAISREKTNKSRFKTKEDRLNK